jgi:nucleoside-diphosphate-sugar epimerase
MRVLITCGEGFIGSHLAEAYLENGDEVFGKHTHALLVETDNIIYGPSSKFRWSSMRLQN